MHFSLVLATIFLAFSAHATPPDPADEVHHFLTDHGLLSRIESASQSVGIKASELILSAMSFLGTPYREGGNSGETGFDCSGFVRAIYSQTIGLILPRRAEQQAAATKKIERTELRPGDLVFFNTMRRAFSHVGIYIGEGKFIHSPKPGGEVRVEDMAVGYWQQRFNGARRIHEPQTQSQPLTAVTQTSTLDLAYLPLP